MTSFLYILVCEDFAAVSPFLFKKRDGCFDAAWQFWLLCMYVLEFLSKYSDIQVT